MLQLILDELKSIPYIVYGFIIIGVGLFIIDSITSAVDKTWKRQR
jgi:hypothetical protein